MTSKVEETPFCDLVLFKNSLSTEPNSDFLCPRSSDYSNPWCSHLVLHSPSLGTKQSVLWPMFLFNLPHDCAPYLINPGFLRQRCVSEWPGKCFQSAHVRVALLLLTLYRRYKLIPRQLYFQQATQMILLSATPLLPHLTPHFLGNSCTDHTMKYFRAKKWVFDQDVRRFEWLIDDWFKRIKRNGVCNDQ